MDVVVHYYNHRKTGQSRVWPSSLNYPVRLCQNYVIVKFTLGTSMFYFRCAVSETYRFYCIENMFDFSHEKHEGHPVLFLYLHRCLLRCYRERLFVNGRTVLSPTCVS